jgi:predicted acyl esterase
MSEDWTQPMETRRTMLKYVGAAAGLGVLGSRVENPWSHPVAALQSDEDSYTTEELRINSFDGTELDATVYEPEADGPHPAILMTHGWGGDKRQLQPLASVYASREFVVLAYTSRGFGQREGAQGSGGQVNSTSELEQEDAQHLIGWLAGRDSVMTDGEENPRIGMDGVSYGGGIQLRTAAHDDRLDAIVPRATWHNLVYSLAPNGVVKSGWLRALELGANQDPPTGNVAPEVQQTSSGILERGSLTDENREFYRLRSPVTYPEIDTPTLLIPEWTDQLFPVNEAVNNFRKVQNSGAETTILIGQGSTHVLGQPGSFPPGSGTSGEFTGKQAVAWLTAHLKGDGDHGLSTVHYYDESADEFRAADEFPPYERQSISHTLDRSVELDGGDGNVVTTDRQISEETDIVGVPTLELTATPTGDGPSNLFVALQRVRDGEVETIKEQVTPVRVEEEEQEIELDLYGVEATFAEGDVLRVAMSAREEPLTSAEPPSFFGGSLYRNTPEGSGIEIAEETEVEFSVPASAELPEQSGVPTPAVSSLADAPGEPQTSAVHDLSEYGYVEEEYMISGTARPTVQDVALLEDEQPPIPNDVAEYATRMLVYTPEDPAQFNGDVVVEWMNVTRQRDAPVTWVNAYDYLLREGYAVVLASAQKVGVDDSEDDRDLVAWNGDRYGDLTHPGDSYAYDIFSQAMQAVKATPSTDPLNGLDVENVLATGMSQSGYYLQPYIADVHPDHGVADGFMPVATNIFNTGVPATTTPTMHLNTEDEAPSQAPDGESYRIWEVAGASHVNVYLSVWSQLGANRDFGAETDVPFEEWNPATAGQYGQIADASYGVCGTNYYPVRFAYRSALDHLQSWVRDGEAPPQIDNIEFEGEGEDAEMVTDEYDNAVGGLRLPVIDEPVASYYARDEVCQPTEENPLANLQGATERLSEDQLTERYDGSDDYVSTIQSAAGSAVERGVLLEADSEELLAQAQAADIPGDGEPSDDGAEDNGSADDGGTGDGAADDGTDDGATDDGEDGDDSGPGFGIPAAAGGAGGLAYLLRRRFGSDETVDADAEE